MKVSDEEWSAFWLWLLEEVKALRERAIEKWPKQTAILRRRQSK